MRGVDHMNIIKTIFDILTNIRNYFPLMKYLAQTGAVIKYEQKRVDNITNFFRHQFSYIYEKRDKKLGGVTITSLPFTDCSVDYSFLYGQINLDESYDSNYNSSMFSMSQTNWSSNPIFKVYEKAVRNGFGNEILLPMKKYLLGWDGVEDPKIVLDELIKERLAELRRNLLLQKQQRMEQEILRVMTDEYNQRNSTPEMSKAFTEELIRYVTYVTQMKPVKKSVKNKKKSVKKSRKMKKSIKNNKK
jgi:hypothetical protein